MVEEIKHDYRRSLGTVAKTIAAGQVGLVGRVDAEPSKADAAG